MVGLAVGAYFGNPQLGLAIGTVLGAVVANAAFPLDPIINRQDNLADIPLTSAAIGQFKPIIYGSWPVGGNIIWAYPILAIEHTESGTVDGGGGKGGFGGQRVVNVTTTYRRHVMVALCEGPISRITRIYLDATLIYDESQPEGWTVSAGARNGDPGTDDDPGAQEPETILYEKSTAETLMKFVLFRGTPTQEPWAFAESLADVAPGTLPAYRGTVVVGCTLDLGVTGRLPNLRFEVTTTVEGLGLPLHVHWLPDEDALWALWQQGPTQRYGAGQAIRYDPYAFTPIATRGLLRDATPAPAGDRHMVASARGQTSVGTDALMILRQDSTMAVLAGNGVLLFDAIDPRTAEEQAGENADEEPVEAPIGGDIAARRDPLDEFLTTLVYLWPNLKILGQCETHTGTTHTFQRLTLPETPHRVVWNDSANAVYVSLPAAGTVVKVTGYATLSITDTISCGSQPTALFVDSTGNCWVTARNDNAVYRFTSSGDRSSAIAVGAAPDDLTEASDGFVWVANTGAASVSRIDPSDLSVETFSLPAAPVRVKAALTDGACWVLSAANRTAYLVQTDGTYAAIQVPRGPSDLAVDEQGQCWVVCGTARQIVRINPEATEILQPEIGNGLACVVRDLNRRAGVPSEWIDVSGLDSSPVNFPIFGLASAARHLEDLAMAYQFLAVETGTGIKYLFKGGVPQATIPEAATLLTDADQAGSLTVERAQPQELPTEVTVVYAAPQRHFHADEQMVQRPYDGPRIPVVQQLPCAFHDAQQARNLAEVLLYEPAFARYAAQVRLPPMASRLEPGDLVTLTTTEGQVYDVRLLKSTTGTDNRVEWETIRHRSYLYENFQSFPSESPPADADIPQPSPVQLHLVEMPPLPGDVEALRLFFAVSRRVSGTEEGFFPAVTLYESTDNEASYQPVTVISTAAQVGLVALALPDGPVHTWDYTTTITVVLRPGSAALVPATPEAPHYAMVGEECVAFVDVTLVAPQTYTLSTIRRGARGTEQHVPRHRTQERFVLMTAALRQKFRAVTPADIGRTRYYKAVPTGANIVDIPGQAHVVQGIFGKPWAPLIISLSHNVGTGDWTISWLHRSRVRGDWVDLTGITYDADDLRSYVLHFYASNTYFPRIATYTSATFVTAEETRTFVYTAAQQTADFGGPQGQLTVGIQGRVAGLLGYEGRATTRTEGAWHADWENDPAVVDGNWTAAWEEYSLAGTPTPNWTAQWEEYDFYGDPEPNWVADFE